MITQEPERFYHTLEWGQVDLAQRKINFNTPPQISKIESQTDRAAIMRSRDRIIVKI